MELTRKQVIEELKAILEMQYWNVPLSKAALEYAISSLKTDEAYQLMYEGEEIYTKADIVVMLTEVLDNVEEVRTAPSVLNDETADAICAGIAEILRAKIDKLKEAGE